MLTLSLHNYTEKVKKQTFIHIIKNKYQDRLEPPNFTFSYPANQYGWTDPSNQPTNHYIPWKTWSSYIAISTQLWHPGWNSFRVLILLQHLVNTLKYGTTLTPQQFYSLSHMGTNGVTYFHSLFTTIRSLTSKTSYRGMYSGNTSFWTFTT